MTDPHSDPAPSDPCWDAARDLYLSGETAEEVCARLSIPSSTFFKRAGEKGWLRRDQPCRAPDDPPLDLQAPADPPEVAVDKAWRRVTAALDAGRSAEAMRWMRVHAALKASARADTAEEDRRLTHRIEAIGRTARGISAQARAELRELQTSLRAEVVEKVESKKSAPAPLDPDAPGLSRAERRRRLKYLAKTRPPTA